MSEKLFQLIYFSRATEETTPEALTDILESSQKNNAKLDITGLLIFENQFFFQILEGHEVDVRQTYEQIRKDPRHCEVFTIIEHSVEARQFERWAMAHYDFQPTDEDLRRQFGLLTEFDSAEEATSFNWQNALRFVAVFETLLKAR